MPSRQRLKTSLRSRRAVELMLLRNVPLRKNHKRRSMHSKFISNQCLRCKQLSVDSQTISWISHRRRLTCIPATRKRYEKTKMSDATTNTVSDLLLSLFITLECTYLNMVPSMPLQIYSVENHEGASQDSHCQTRPETPRRRCSRSG